MIEKQPWDEVLAQATVELMPGWVQATKTVLDQVYVRYVERGGAALQEVVEKLDGPELLAEALERSTLLEAAFMDGMDVAARTSIDAKRRRLAQVITQAVLDDARVDEALLTVQVLRELDAPHLRALATIVRIEDEVIATYPNREATLDWTRWDDAVKQFKQEPFPVQAALARTGCVETPPNTFVLGGPVMKVATRFGRELLAHLREFASDGGTGF